MQKYNRILFHIYMGAFLIYLLLPLLVMGGGCVQ